MTKALSQPWAPYYPRPESPWDLSAVAHLHRRAGFAASWSVLHRDLNDGPEASVTRLLKGEPNTPDGRPAAAHEALASAMSRQLAPGATLQRLQALWIYRMVFTPHPLRERMTLFWHDHFATSEAKVKNAGLMNRQNDLFRKHALGDFKALLAEVGRDPAMLIWLDSTENRKARPNENYAREVMELFALGRGQYTEKDVQEAARAFTGWFVRGDRFQEIAAQHDGGEKNILGRTGRFGGSDLPAILLDQPACAEFLCEKLVRAFVTEVDAVGPEVVAPLAEALRGSGYDICRAVEMVLRSDWFFHPSTRRRRVKSPVELAVGTVRALEIFRPTAPPDALAEACAAMGQGLYAPPSVAGWDGGTAWINSTAMLGRNNLALGLLGADAPLGGRFDAGKLASKHGFDGPKTANGFLADLLVQDGFDADVRGRVAAADGPKTAATLVLTSPEYQLA